MRKPNTSLLGKIEARSVRISTCGELVLKEPLLGGVTALLPKNLQHWMKEQPELLQAMHNNLTLYGIGIHSSRKLHLGDTPSTDELNHKVLI